MQKKDIIRVIKEKHDAIEAMGYEVSSSGRSIGFHNFSVDIVMSKYGYNSEFGLNFFFRATKKNAPRDEWGNIPPFIRGLEYDWTPASIKEFSKVSYQRILSAYDENLKNKLDSYFCALDKNMLEELILIAFETFARKLRSVEPE